MRVGTAIWVVFSMFFFTSFGQTMNGRIDGFKELAIKYSESIKMSDGVRLQTDIYLPIFMDSLTFPIDVGGLGKVNITAFHKGVQYIYYDSVNGKPNPAPYELPTILIRTPYNKNNENIGYLMAFLGYSVVVQDNRGAYSSEGNYLPMYSDAWRKEAYHPDFSHSLDVFANDNTKNANKQQDGFESLQYILHHLKRNYLGKNIFVSNGSVGMIGTSALGNVQYQLAASHPIDQSNKGLKGLLPIVATNEHYRSTAVHNGVFREALVTNWVHSQYRDLVDDSSITMDPSRSNNIHSPADFNVSSKQIATQRAIDYWITRPNGNGLPGYYPNSLFRSDLDASHAPLNEDSTPSPLGKKSRYTNMEVPIYHLTGWWDIFIDGQIETFNQLQKHLSSTKGNKAKQKLVIGPWAHQTVTELHTGDVTYPDNVLDFLTDLQFLGRELNAFPMEELQNSEILQWFRYTLNNNAYKNVGTPKIKIPAAKDWKKLGGLFEVLAPSEDFIIPFHTFINYLGGKGGLDGFPYQIKTSGFVIKNKIELKPSQSPFIALGNKLEALATPNFKNKANVRLYVASANKAVANYWLEKDSFPFKKDITNQKLYLSEGNQITAQKQFHTSQESYVHNPDNPVRTVGGANMTVLLPNENKKSQGQINLASTKYAPATMNRPDVLSFTSKPLIEEVEIVGIPTADLYASSSPLNQYTDSTNTDFMVRILDVLPSDEEYFVVEGAVNARAMAYAQQLAMGKEDSNIPFRNILSGNIYHYKFNCLPIAYAFGKGHKIKVLVSSSNYPRYQSNPNIPLVVGDFFRRKPNEKFQYNYYGKLLTARKAQQRIMLGAEYPSSITLPVHQGAVRFNVTALTKDVSINHTETQVYPNPASEFVNINSEIEQAKIECFDLSGKLVLPKFGLWRRRFNVSTLRNGLYLLKITDTQSGKSQIIPFSVQK